VAGDVLYLDASTLVKLVVSEAESGALGELVAESGAHASSIVAAVEVPRAVGRVTDAEAPLERADRLLSMLDLRVLDDEVVREARKAPRGLRSLDAIHLGSAITLGDALTAFVAYDRRLQAAARDLGLPLAAPARG